jgi:hypothetical protein
MLWISLVKELVEDTLDAANPSCGPVLLRGLAATVRTLMAFKRVIGGDNTYDDSWRGNRTDWCACLDFQRELHYALLDGTRSNQSCAKATKVSESVGEAA